MHLCFLGSCIITVMERYTNVLARQTYRAELSANDCLDGRKRTSYMEHILCGRVIYLPFLT